MTANNIKNENIRKVIDEKKALCVFVGAGASIREPSALPSFQALNDEILQNLYKSDSLRHRIEKQITDIHIKPEQLLQILWDYTSGNLNPVECFQYAQPNINHYMIVQLVSEGVQCIITPNFDPCLEKAMEINDIEFELYNKTPDTEAEAEKLLSSIQSGEKVLWKPHGDCRAKDTLCYTRTKVAKLSKSRYLYKIFSYIIEHFNLLFLGYSGYDDDFYPILHQCITNSKKQIIWNSYSEPEDTAPCISLQKRAADRFHIWVGDMTELLRYSVSSFSQEESKTRQVDWKEYLRIQFETIVKSKKIAMIAKYINDYGLYDEAFELWREGLRLSAKELDDEDKLRFELNLGIMDEKSVYEYAMAHSYFYIAEIALQRILQISIAERNVQSAKYYLGIYLGNCGDIRCKEYFKKGKYYNWVYQCKELDISYDFKTKLETDFEVAYTALLDDGEITDALELLVKHYQSIAAQNFGNRELLQELIDKSSQVIPYGEKRVIAQFYFCITNMAITLYEYEIARTYHKKTAYFIEMCHSMGIFIDDQYYELMANLYHQKSLLALDKKNAIAAEKLAIEYTEKICSREKQTYLKCFFYGGLCSIYMRDEYHLAKKYGEIGLLLCKQADNKQSMARTLTYLAVADALHHRKNQAIKKFRMAYNLYIQINENLEAFSAYLKECGIDISEIK